MPRKIAAADSKTTSRASRRKLHKASGSGAESRPQGKTGVNELRRLAKNFVVEESKEDHTGWDIQLEEKLADPTDSAEFLGRRGNYTYKIQVKSPRVRSAAHLRRSVGIELQHWERACKSSDPWYVFIAIADDDDEDKEDDVHDVFLVHIGAAWLAKAAKRLASCTNMKKEMHIAWTESDRIKPRTRRNFAQALKSPCDVDPLVYAATKQHQWNQAGFENRRTELAVSACSDLTEQKLTDIYLGRETVSEDRLTEIVRRFGLEISMDRPSPGMYRVNAARVVEIEFYRASTARAGLTKHRGVLIIHNMALFHSGPVTKHFPNHVPVLRISTRFVEIQVTNGRLTIEIRLGHPTALISLLGLAAASFLSNLYRRAYRRGGLFCVHTVDPPNVWTTSVIANMKLPAWQRAAYKAATEAREIIQKFGGSLDQDVTISSLLQQRNALTFMRYLVCEREGLSFAGHVRLDSDPSVNEFQSLVPYNVAVQVGRFRVVIGGVIVRNFKRITDLEYQWTSAGFEVLLEEAGEGLSDQLPGISLRLVAAQAELRCYQGNVPFLELTGFAQERWPDPLAPPMSDADIEVGSK